MGYWVVVFGDGTPDRVLIDLPPECFGDLLSDSAAAKARYALFQFDDCLNESPGRSPGTGLVTTSQ